jgi:hypothetical protein
MNIEDPQNVWTSLNVWATVIFSRMIPHALVILIKNYLAENMWKKVHIIERHSMNSLSALPANNAKERITVAT